MDYKKNIPLIIGLAIPLVMIILVAASIYIPTLYVHPTHDFLYKTGGGYYTQQQYVVDHGKLVKRDIQIPDSEKDFYLDRARTTDVRLYLHNVSENSSREISFEEAQQLTLDPNKESPDGFTISRGSYGGELFGVFGGSQNGAKRYLKTKAASIELNLKSVSTDDYYGDFQFLGWIVS